MRPLADSQLQSARKIADLPAFGEERVLLCSYNQFFKVFSGLEYINVLLEPQWLYSDVCWKFFCVDPFSLKRFYYI
jgi:hypothetical protein